MGCRPLAVVAAEGSGGGVHRPSGSPSGAVNLDRQPSSVSTTSSTAAARVRSGSRRVVRAHGDRDMGGGPCPEAAAVRAQPGPPGVERIDDRLESRNADGDEAGRRHDLLQEQIGCRKTRRQGTHALLVLNRQRRFRHEGVEERDVRRHPTTHQSRVDTPRRIEERGGIGQANDDGSGPWLWHAVIIAGQSATAPIALRGGRERRVGVVEAVAAGALAGDSDARTVPRSRPGGARRAFRVRFWCCRAVRRALRSPGPRRPRSPRRRTRRRGSP